MELKDFFLNISQNWNELDEMSSPTQKLLRNSHIELKSYINEPYVVKGSGGEGKVTFTPWVAWFHPDSSLSAKDGIYVVYLFSRSMKFLNLSLNQGVRNKLEREGKKAAHLMLQSVAAGLQKQLKPEKDFKQKMILEYDGALQEAYISGSISNKRYLLNKLPSNEEMIEDLSYTLELYSKSRDITYDPQNNLPIPKIRKQPKKSVPDASGVKKQPAETRTQLVERLVSNSKVKNFIKALYNGECQICRTKLSTPSGNYSETAHIKAKKDGGDDHESNVLSLCSNCHSLFDNRALWIDENYKVYHFKDGELGKLFVHPKHLIEPTNFKEHKKLSGW